MSTFIGDDEAKRLFTLHSLHILDTPAEERFDRLTRLARRVFDIPFAAINLLDRERTFIKSISSTSDVPDDAPSLFTEYSHLCVIQDAQEDRSLAAKLAIFGAPKVRFYASQPLFAPDGSFLGALTIIDIKPRAFAFSDIEALRDFAVLVQLELGVVRMSQAQMEVVIAGEARAEPVVDDATRLWNQRSIVDVLERELAHAAMEEAHGHTDTKVAVVLADVEQVRVIAGAKGNIASSRFARSVGQRLLSCVRPYDAVGRFSEDEFLVVLPGCMLEGAKTTSDRIRQTVGSDPICVADSAVYPALTLGIAASTGRGETTAQLIADAKTALYAVKMAARDDLQQHSV